MTHPTPSRRHLLLGGGAVFMASGLLTGCTPAPAVSAPAKTVLESWPVGMQLYTVNAELAKDIPGTLKAVKEAGYDVVETAGLQGLPVSEYRGLIEAAGLKVRSAHTNMGNLIDHADQEIADALALGAEWLVCSSPKPTLPLDPKKDWVVAMTEAMTADGWKANAAELAQIAPKVRAAGLKLAYHNHPMEFKDLGNGTTGYDLLMAAAPADQLRAELDLGWVAVAGLDPVATMRKYADRLDLLHVKDMVRDDKAGAGFRSTEIGHGMIDWKPVFAAAQELGVKAYFIEQEPPYLKPVIESLRESRAYIAGL